MRLSLRRLDLLTPLSLEKMAAERDLLRAEFAARYRGSSRRWSRSRPARPRTCWRSAQGVARIAELDGAARRGDRPRRPVREEIRRDQGLSGGAHGAAALDRIGAARHDRPRRAADRQSAQCRDRPRGSSGGSPRLHRTQVATHEFEHRRPACAERRNAPAARRAAGRAGARAGRGAAARRGRRRAGADDARARRRDRREDRSRSARWSETRGAAADAGAQRHGRDSSVCESALRVARAEERDHADRLEAARSDNALLQGAVDALRREHAHLRESAVAGRRRAARRARRDRASTTCWRCVRRSSTSAPAWRR